MKYKLAKLYLKVGWLLLYYLDGGRSNKIDISTKEGET